MLEFAKKDSIDSELHYRTLVEQSLLGVILMQDDRIVFANSACARMTGYTVEKILSLPPEKVKELVYPDDRKSALSRHQNRIKGKFELRSYELRIKKKDGSVYWVQTFSSSIEYKGKPAIMSAFFDITKRKYAEKLVKERTKNLEDTNAALRVLLKRREVDRADIEEKVLINVKKLVFPYLEKLKISSLNDNQRAYMDIMESNLNNIISPFVRDISSKLFNLTPTEIHVASLVKDGRSSKEIAEVLNTAKRTVDSHRRNIRKKIGIANKKTNLRTFLLSIE